MQSHMYCETPCIDVVTVLPSYLNKSELYKIYIKEVQKPHVKKSNFYSIFKTDFGPKRENKNLPWIRKVIFIILDIVPSVKECLFV
jgi:hypothetical protein